MHSWGKHIFVAAAPLLLTGCLWGPGKFTSDLTLKKDGSLVLDYRGEIMLQMPDKDANTRDFIALSALSDVTRGASSPDERDDRCSSAASRTKGRAGATTPSSSR